jgi:hypothetical protein
VSPAVLRLFTTIGSLARRLPTLKSWRDTHAIVKFLQLVEFEQTQHYKNRTPPWIKLYRELLNKREFFRLSESQRYQYIGLQLLASECNNKIPYDQEWLKQRLKTSRAVDVKALVKAVLLRVIDDAATRDIPAPEECWTVAVNHHNRYSTDIGTGWLHGTPELPAVIQAAVRTIGGWDRIAALRKNERDLPFARREFLQALNGGGRK